MGRRIGLARLRWTVTAATVSALIAGAGPAAASVTIGSNLGRAPTVQFGGTAQRETDSQLSLDSGSRAQGGLTAPVNGTVVRWRIRIGGSAGAGGALRVIRPLGGNLFTGAGTSATVLPTINATTTYETRLPIQIGDRVGLDRPSPGGIVVFVANSAASFDSWVPALADGSPGQSPDSPPSMGYELAINADIEPISGFTIDKVKPKRGGKVVLKATLPNPGSLVAGSAPRRGAANASTKKKKLLKTLTTQITGPRQVAVTLKPTKVARRELLSHRRLKTKVRVSYTPTGGTAATNVVPVRLRA